MSQSVDTIAPPPTAAEPAKLLAHADKDSVRTLTPPATRLLPWLSTWIILLSLAALASSLLVVTYHGSRGFFLPTLAAMLCMLAALFDGYTARIPNPLTYPAILLGLFLNGITPGLEFLHAHPAVVWLGAVTPSASLAGFAVCAFLGIAGCLLAGVHGGDLKLLAALGALLGLTATANVLILALIVALAYALLNLICFGGLNAVIQRGSMRALEALYFRRFQTPLPEDNPKSTSHIPMAVPLALGLIIAHIWQLRGGTLL